MAETKLPAPGVGELTALLLSRRLHLESSNLSPGRSRLHRRRNARAAQHGPRGHRPVLILVTAVAAALVLAACSVTRSATPTAVPTAQGQQVGLGDSYTACPGSPGRSACPPSCARSSRNCPLVRRSLRLNPGGTRCELQLHGHRGPARPDCHQCTLLSCSWTSLSPARGPRTQPRMSSWSADRNLHVNYTLSASRLYACQVRWVDKARQAAPLRCTRS